MQKFALCLSLFGVSASFAGDEKTQASKSQDSKPAEIVVIGKPSRFRVVTQPVQVLKTEVVTKTSTSPATLVVEEKRGLFGKWRTKNSAVVITENKK